MHNTRDGSKARAMISCSGGQPLLPHDGGVEVGPIRGMCKTFQRQIHRERPIFCTRSSSVSGGPTPTAKRPRLASRQGALSTGKPLPRPPRLPRLHLFYCQTPC
eukprot:1194714-Prorocentrum_minimum.AAC.4